MAGGIWRPADLRLASFEIALRFFLSKSLERLEREHDFNRDIEVSRDAKSQVQRGTELSAFEIADRLIVHAERVGQLAARDPALGAQHRYAVMDDVAGVS